MSISRSKWLSDVRGDRYEEESWILDIHCDLPEIDHIELFRLQFEKKKTPSKRDCIPWPRGLALGSTGARGG